MTYQPTEIKLLKGLKPERERMRSYWSGLLCLTLAIAFSASLISLFFGSVSLDMVPLNYSEKPVNENTLGDFKTNLIGLKFSEQPTSEAGMISRDRLPPGTRIIPKGAFVTMDYEADRLNLKLDDQMKVEKVTIG